MAYSKPANQCMRQQHLCESQVCGNVMKWNRLLVLCFCALLSVPAFSGASNLDTPLSQASTSSIVSQFVRKHYAQQPLDDEMAKRVFSIYINRLDPGHYYFLQSDIDEFRKYETRIDELLKAGNTELAVQLFTRFKTRLSERIEMLETFLKEDFDFKKDEKWLIDRKEAQYPKDQKDAADIWRRKIKFDLLTLTLGGSTIEEAKERLSKRLKSAWKEYSQYPESDIVSLYLNALTEAYDPHSSYLSARDLSDFNINIKLSLEGIGAVLRWEDGYTVVSSIVPGGAAFREGSLKPNDRIISVAQAEEPFESVIDMRLKDVVQLIRGERGTKVRLQVLRKSDEGYDPKTITIIRDKIILKDREAKSVLLTKEGSTPKEAKEAKETKETKVAEAKKTKEADSKKAKETKETKETKEDKSTEFIQLATQGKRIGVIQLPSFYIDFNQRRLDPYNYKSSSRDVQKHLQAFVDEGVDGVILDLRDNGGGGLDEAISMSGLFIGRQPIVVVRQASGRTRVHRSQQRAVYNGPLMVLINRSSASATEIFAGAMQDYGRAILIGDVTTFGKGTVQNVDALPEGYGALKITVAQFYRVSGSSTQNKGVEPDIVFPSIRNEWEFGEATLDYALPWKRISPVSYIPQGNVIQYVYELQKLSNQRIQAVEYFQKVQKNTEEYVTEIKPRKYVSILELQADFNEKEQDKDKKEELSQAEKDAKEEEQKKKDAEEEQKYMDEVFGSDELKISHKDAYMKEALNVFEDYIQMLESKKQ